MADQAVLPHYQAILDLGTRSPIGYEVLGRSRLFGLQTAESMFSAAAALNMEAELSRALRSAGVRDAAKLGRPQRIFLNTHPREMDDLPVLGLSLRELREFAGERRLTLELHEGALTCVRQMRELRALLSDLSIELAYDDFGAGQGRLVELVEVPPDYLKFDMGLIQQIDVASQERQRMLASLVQMAKDLGIVVVAEGVETAGEDAFCREIGFDCAQGFLYGKPMIPERCPYAESEDPASGGAGD
jgi:EAL domain-containing protein (putative c-di-GMP-specific phosphodiesterase class I)